MVPYPPGGPLDTMARMLAEKVRASLGQPVIVENRSGAGGNIGADLVAKAPADGYTLVMGAVATHAINPWLFANLPYDPVKDFAPVTIVASVPNVLVMNVEFAQKNKIEKLAGLIDYAKKNPGKLNYGSGGNGSAGHLSGELLARAGISVEHIPYQGAAPAQLALLSGQSDFMFDNLAASAADQGRQGQGAGRDHRQALLVAGRRAHRARIRRPGLRPGHLVRRLHHGRHARAGGRQAEPGLCRRDEAGRRQAAPADHGFGPDDARSLRRVRQERKGQYQEIVKISGASLN